MIRVTRVTGMTRVPGMTGMTRVISINWDNLGDYDD